MGKPFPSCARATSFCRLSMHAPVISTGFSQKIGGCWFKSCLDTFRNSFGCPGNIWIILSCQILYRKCRIYMKKQGAPFQQNSALHPSSLTRVTACRSAGRGWLGVQSLYLKWRGFSCGRNAIMSAPTLRLNPLAALNGCYPAGVGAPHREHVSPLL